MDELNAGAAEANAAESVNREEAYDVNMCVRLRYFNQKDGQYASCINYGCCAAAGRYVLSDDANIYYEVYGEGAPFVVLHGGGSGCAYEMGQFIDILQQRYKVIVISTRGHGCSEIGSTPFELAQRADDIKAVLDNEGIAEPALILGFSDGGYAGYAFCALYPDRAAKLIAIGAGEVLKSSRSWVFSVDLWRDIDPDFTEQQLSIMPEPERWPEMLRMYERMWNNTIVSKNIFNHIKCPVLIINGEKDANSPLSSAFSAYNMISDANLAVIPDCGHACFMENFASVWAAAEPFLNKA